jgi:diacylglycerol kinase (ATP)
VTRKVTLVVNPSAGKGRAQEMLPHVAGRFRDAGLDLEILLSRDFGEARQMSSDAVASGVDVLAVMGGDGMMHLGVNTCAPEHLTGGRPTALGLIPAGTGNDLCRGVGLDPADPVAAAGVIAGGRTAPIDLMRVNARFVGAVLATGFDALVNGRANAWSWPKGSMRYPLATLMELRVFSPLRYRLSIDGQVRELDAMFVAIGNTACYGGGMRICPDANPTDGMLDVTIIHPVSRLKLLRLLPLMYSGRFAKDRCVERMQAREITVEGPGLVGYGDGELISAAPLRVSVVPRAVPLCVP